VFASSRDVIRANEDKTYLGVKFWCHIRTKYVQCHTICNYKIWVSNFDVTLFTIIS
jgi:hypothetical protein